MSSNFRHHLLGLSLLIGIVAPWVAFAQAPISSVGSDSVEGHVTQFERISNAHNQLLTQLQQQPSNNWTGIDPLRDQIQGNRYQLNQIAERRKQIPLQIDSLSSGGGATVVPGTQAPSSSGDRSVATTNAAPATSSDASVMTGDANTDYNAAVVLVKDTSRQDDVMMAFQNLVRKCPDSTYQPNADCQFGRSNHNKGKKSDTTFYFTSVVKSYSKSPKVPDTMFKVDVIMQNKGDTAKAKTVYQQVISKFPSIDDAKQM